MDSIRIANVSYLNSAPYRMVSDLVGVDYSENSPSECARKLSEGEVDLACIPLAEYLAHGGYQMLEFGIGSPGPVESVLLLSHSPIEQLENVILDYSSQTSVILLRVLLNELLPDRVGAIKFSKIEPLEVASRVGGKTGGLLIGDEALAERGNFPYVWDLADLWRRHTGLPFVFAVWAGKLSQLDTEKLAGIVDTFALGVKHRDILAREWAEAHAFNRDRAEEYVNSCILYRLGEDERRSMVEFQRLASNHGFLPFSLTNIFEPFLTAASSNGRLRPVPPRLQLISLDRILSDSSSGRRISVDSAIRMATEASLTDLGLAADIRRRALFEHPAVSYIVDRNINYTNVCNVYCRFCAFYEPPKKDVYNKGGYLLSKEEIGRKIQETIDAGGIQILLQGGLNPELGIEYYEDLFRWIKENYAVNLHALSADEIMHITKVSNLSVEEVLNRLMRAGLGSLPGGGAEILVDRIRYRIARLKTGAREWLNVHRVAHRLGLISTCTMMFGVQETWEDRILHLNKLRQLQDETGGFTAFITWPFQEENTNLKKGDTSSLEYLRVQAVSRLFLDNITHIQSSWVTQGPSVGQIALYYGADDFGSVMFEENVVSAAGTTFCIDSATIERHIIEAGFMPWQRDVWYQQVRL